MSREQSNSEKHYDVLVRLAKGESWVRGDLDSTLREVTTAAADTMGIERVNVWLFGEQRTKIRCIEHYERSSGEHSPGGFELSAADYPIYFRALDAERTIVADDARSDPRTCEFTEGYLDLHGITSMLDAPLHSGGDVIGIICHEHVGPQRVWSEEEQRFAGSLADLASLALESKWRRQSESLTREIIANALDAIVIVDRDGLITDWNPRAESVFGWSREEAIGMTLYDSVVPPKHHEEHRRGMQRYLETGEGRILGRRIEVTARDKHGREFPVELAITPVRIGDSLGFGAFVRDITDRVRAELEVHKLNAQLEERVQERTRQLESAVQDKERLLAELQDSSVELLDRLCQLEHKSATIRSDLERAQVIQRALLPAEPPVLDGFRVDALYRPGMSVGGDLYDVKLLADGKLVVYVADAAGHGVAAAMLSVLFKQHLQLRDASGRALSPGQVLRRVNAKLYAGVLSQGLFLTAGYVLLDPSTGELRAASAGHTPIFVHRANGNHEFLERTGPALGIDQDAQFAEHRIWLERGDRLVLYTDGLIDGLGSGGQPELGRLLEPVVTGGSRGGPQRLRKLYAETCDRSAAEAGSAGRDDVTLLVLEASGGTSHFDNDPSREVPPSTRQTQRSVAPSWNLWIADGEQRTWLSVRGQGTWLDSEGFSRIARAALKAGNQLTIDLSQCTHLDSAFLGTLHDVVAGGAPGTISVRRPCASVRGLFGELGLERVLDTVCEEAGQPPCELEPVTQEPPERESQQRLLRAHEILSELSEENRERFSGVVKSLRAELGATGALPPARG